MKCHWCHSSTVHNGRIHTLTGNNRPWEGIKHAEDKQKNDTRKEGLKNYAEVTIYTGGSPRILWRLKYTLISPQRWQKHGDYGASIPLIGGGLALPDRNMHCLYRGGFLTCLNCSRLAWLQQQLVHIYSAPNKESTFSKILISAVKSTFSHSNHHKSIKEVLWICFLKFVFPHI